MKLPNVEHAVVPEMKVRKYLLSRVHPKERMKAVFFASFGFTDESWEILVQALQKHAGTNDVKRMDETPYGMQYIIEGAMTSPDRRNPVIRTVWLVPFGDDIARFVTAYPIRGPRHDT